MTTFKNITVLGTGVLGSQIAYQTAFRGFQVTVWDIDGPALERAKERFAQLASFYASEVELPSPDAPQAALERIRGTSDFTDAVKDADLVIEAVPENLELKRDVWAKVGAAAPEKTIFATNTSSLLPSSMALATGRPDRFLALHYANNIWQRNIAEVMRTEYTDPDVFQQVVTFAEEQGMIPIRVQKEQPGYVANTILFATLRAAIELYLNEVADMPTIDEAFRVSMVTPLGPFQLLDMVGMTTVYNVYSVGNEVEQRFAKLVKTEYIDNGKLGRSTGEGFYRYADERVGGSTASPITGMIQRNPMYEDVTFSLPDVQLHGRIYRPDGDGPHPVVIFHSGLGSVAEGNYGLADLFRSLGLAVLFYDHRGFGYSGGDLRQEVDPLLFARDLRDVITLLADRDDVDERRISLSGFSLGGMIDLLVAGVDRRVAGVVSVVAPISGLAARDLFPPEALPAVDAAVEAGRREQLLGGQSPVLQATGERVPGGPEVMFDDPIGAEFIKQFDGLPSYRNEVTLTSLGRLFETELLPFAARITAPLLLIVGSEDTISRVEDAREFFEQVRSPKLLEEHPGQHYAVLIGDGYKQLVARSAEWLAENATVPVSR